MPRAAEWESRWWSPIVNAEHLAMRDRVGWSTWPRSRSSTSPAAGRSTTCERTGRGPDGRRPIGRVVYTPLLNAGGRHPGRPDDHAPRPRPVPGRDRRRHGHARPKMVRGPPAAPTAPSQLQDLTYGFYDVRGLGAPRARPRRGRRRREADLARGLPVRDLPTVDIDGVRTLASRISYVGELGWEIYVPMEQGLPALGRALARRPAPRHGPGGHRHVRRVRAARKGLSRPRRRARARLRPRLGRDGPAEGEGGRLRRPSGLHRAAFPTRPPRSLCTLTVDDPTSPAGVQRYMLGRSRSDPERQAARRREGPPLVRDARGVRPVGRGPPA